GTGAALLPGRRLRSCYGSVRPAVSNQRAELCSLQDMRYKRPGTEHHLGHAGGRGRSQLLQYVRRSPLPKSSLPMAAIALLVGIAPAISLTSSDDEARGYGAYLSGRFAADEHDISNAAKYYGSSLNRVPNDPTLQALAFFYSTSAGD